MTDIQMISKVIDGNQKYGLLTGNCEDILAKIPENSIDCVITSPPYWQMREYSISEKDCDSVIGTEKTPEQYVMRLTQIFSQIRRVLKVGGSVWLNLGDKYYNKNLMGMPWRVALAMQEDKWILRNDIIWHQMKGTQSAKDRLRDVHEHLFHFVKSKKYYYDADSIRIKPSKLPIINGKETISATGVSGKKYRSQILTSKDLNEDERTQALKALDDTLEKIRIGELVDFRMTIRGAQRTYHSNSSKISGRAKELEAKGFFILTSKAKGYLPSDVWNIVPEDEWRKDVHYAVFPTELLQVPIKATCPVGGVVLDPFIGTGSTLTAANQLNRRGLGIEISKEYVKIAESRLETPQLCLSI